MDKRYDLEIAKLIGEPISTALPVPYEISAIADFDTVAAGERAYRYSGVDTDPDILLAWSGDGVMRLKKRSPLSDVEVPLVPYDSKMEYVYLKDVLESPDTDKLARRKGSITRGMDKAELRAMIALIEADNNTLKPGVDVERRDPESTEDLYDAIIGMKHKIENIGDNFTLLCGSAVKEAIDLYDKVYAEKFHYNVTLSAKLKELGIDIVKIFGEYSSDATDTETRTDLMNTNHAILVAKNSRLAEGKPVKFVRRLISAEVAAYMGATVDNQQRAILVNQTPVLDAATNLWAYGVIGMESYALFISNPYAIIKADLADVVGDNLYKA
jgi:hypothetical protein